MIGELATCRNGGHFRDCIYHSCPQHYKCEYSYCIPLQAVCNGVIDCPYGEDEKNCEKLSCPNTLKCKRDNVCVHFNSINDGTVDYPAYEDDEATAQVTVCLRIVSVWSMQHSVQEVTYQTLFMI